MATMRTIDLHCDLLSYLASDSANSPHDSQSRCSIEQLRQGRVALQTLAIFSPTGPESTDFGRAQATCYRSLLRQERESFEALESPEQLAPALSTEDSNKTLVIAAIENGSVFSQEGERLQIGLDRLEAIESITGKLLYVGLTWKSANRFGGGNESQDGLTHDGRSLVECLVEKGIAIDLSHASHWLAGDILDFLYAKGLEPQLLASHSNFQAVRDIPRNLPDEIADEIIRRRGVIGMNFLRLFLQPESWHGLLANAKHALTLGGAGSLCFGADFFAESIIPNGQGLPAPDGYFLPDFANASCYPELLRLFREEASWPTDFLSDLAHGNARRFLEQSFA